MTNIVNLPNKQDDEDRYLLHFTSREETKHIREKVSALADEVSEESSREFKELEQDARNYAKRKLLDDNPILSRLLLNV